MKNLNPLEKFEIVKMNRSQIKGAPYNPRKISDKAKLKLKANLKKVGLLEPLVVNKRTGNLVSGHQRLSQLDALLGSPDYQMTIALVDLDLKTEKEQNIFMNNPAVMGEFDADAMVEMFKEIDFKNTGMELSDLSAFGVELSINEFESLPLNQQESRMIDDIETTQDLLPKKTGDAKDSYNGKLADMDAKHLDEHPEMKYFIVTFPSRADKNAFLESVGFEEDDKYVDGNVFKKIIAELNQKPNETVQSKKTKA